ncbi:hypothetical protein F5Y15DRAFT_429818 [Xylariaceae sp. FL0016]|nr:hypothetical protein F5Y15DRAFT_429818 [Xylariaceae sp. FL0016]
MASTQQRNVKLYDQFKRVSGLPNTQTPPITWKRISERVEQNLSKAPFKLVVDDIEELIQILVPPNKRTEIYPKVFDGVTGVRKVPRWESPVDNPRAVPQTPFSEPRAVSLPVTLCIAAPTLDRDLEKETETTCLHLYQKFVAASKLADDVLRHIRSIIVWRDTERSNGTWGALDWEDETVRGGRLGPTEEHNLWDVPRCSLGDCLMASTLTDIHPQDRASVRKFIFPDLSSAQITEYVSIIEKQEDKLQKHDPPKKKRKRRNQETFDRRQAVRLEEVLDMVDENINLAPNLSFLKLQVTSAKISWTWVTKYGTRRSILEPGRWLEGEESEPVESGESIDRDCDQIRAMIKIFVRKGDWSMDEFILALGGPRRPELKKFLEKRGLLEGRHSSAFQRSWELFKRRELLGYQLTDPPPPPPQPKSSANFEGF